MAWSIVGLPSAVFAQTPASAAASGQAWPGELRSEKTQGHGRLIMTFPEPVGAIATVAGGVLIVKFDRKVALGADRLPLLLPAYVTAARLDPDQRTLRMALTQSIRADLKDAAEALYLDLMPARWRGPPPALPADVADRLAKRLRESKAVQYAAIAAKAPPQKIVAVAARAVGRTRITLPLPSGVTASANALSEAATVELSGDALFDQPAVRAALASTLGDVVFPSATTMRFTVPAETAFRTMIEDGALVIEMVTPEAPAPAPIPPAPVSQAPGPAPTPAAEKAPPQPTEKVLGEAVFVQQDQQLALRLTPRIPAAVFERDGAIQIVMANTRAIRAPKVQAAEKALGIAGIAAEQYDGFSRISVETSTTMIPAVTEDAGGWTIRFVREPAGGVQPIRVERAPGEAGHLHLSMALPQPADPIWIEGQEAGDRVAVIPVAGPPHAMLAAQTFTDLVLVKTALGLVVEPRADDLILRSSLDGAVIDRKGGLVLSQRVAEVADDAQKGPIFNTASWEDDRRGVVRDTERALLSAAADAPKRGKTAARLRLASFYLANGQGPDAAAVLAVATADDPRAAHSRQALMMNAYAHALAGNDAAAKAQLSEAAVALDPEAILLRAAVDARLGQPARALEAVRGREAALERLPESFQAHILPPLIEAALSLGDTFLAGHLISTLEQLDASERDTGAIPYFNGRLAEAGGRKEEALAAYATAAKTGARPIEAEARLSRALLGSATGLLPADVVRAELETVSMIWRRGPVEVRASARLAEIAATEGRWRDAFMASRRAVEIMPDHPVTRALQDDMEKRFEKLFLGGDSSKLSKVETLAIFDEFRALVPPGPKGDVIVRHLSDRLIDLDLVPQAIDLLTYQVNNRLKGPARAEAAARLALLQLSEAAAQDALATLKATRLSNLPADLRQQRLHIEARALSELSRTDLALEIIGAEQGSEADRLRADILWRAKRWGEAAEAYERSLGERWQAADALTAIERTDALRAAIGFVLASDSIGTDRLRSKFMAKMAESPDGDMFRLTTIDYLSRPDAFQAMARRSVGARALSDFLPAYRKRFGGT
jgi:hypothetical protein